MTIASPFSNTFAFDSCMHSPTQGSIIKNLVEVHAHRKESIALCEGSRRILTVPNAGGNSVWSEVLSCEVLTTLFHAKLLRTEMELEYDFYGCKITDYSVVLNGERFGVSVTRAMKFNGVFGDEDAQNLLKKKLDGVNQSTRCVSTMHSWKKQILHVWAEHEYVADVLMKNYALLDAELQNNTMVVVSVALNAKWIYTNH